MGPRNAPCRCVANASLMASPCHWKASWSDGRYGHKRISSVWGLHRIRGIEGERLGGNAHVGCGKCANCSNRLGLSWNRKAGGGSEKDGGMFWESSGGSRSSMLAGALAGYRKP